jgi:hypothetical protein
MSAFGVSPSFLAVVQPAFRTLVYPPAWAHKRKGAVCAAPERGLDNLHERWSQQDPQFTTC